jgi:transposase
MKAYSLDLRQRVVAAVEHGEGTLEEVAALFRVGTTFVKKMLRLHRQGDSLAPRHGGGAPSALNDDHRAMLRAAVETRRDATLRELRGFLRAECRIDVSEATLCRELQKLNLPRKKKASSRVNGRSANAGRFAARSPRGM